MTQSNAMIMSFIAGEAITERYCVIQDPDNADKVLLPTADNMKCIGFADDAQATAGLHVAVHTSGGYRLAVADGDITKDDLLICADGGKVKTDPATGSTTSYIVGQALEDGTDGNQIRILVRFQIKYNA